MELIPVRSEIARSKFDLFSAIRENIESSGESILDGDIIVISSKYVAISQGRMVELSSVRPTAESSSIAEKYKIDPRIAQLIVQEADYLYGGIDGFILAVKEDILAPNAGIDKSNIPHGFVVLYPTDSFDVARNLAEKFMELDKKKIGIVISDSRLMPTRIGTVGVAIAVAGFEPVQDLRGKKDLFGRELRVTLRAVADSLATAANLLMGESDEATPIVIVRNFPARFTEKPYSSKDLSIDHSECIFVRGLRYNRSDIPI